MKATAMAQVANRRFDQVQLDIAPIGAGQALLRVEACGLCGTDLAQYQGQVPTGYPIIPGHEPVGIIEELGREAASSWGVKVGDRVALIPKLSCGRCETCLAGYTQRCHSLFPVAIPSYGYIPMSFEHGLWGGYSDYIHLHPRTLLCKVPPNVPARFATLYQALAGGLRWAVQLPKVTFADTVLVLSAGQRGLAAVIMLKAAGVHNIIVTGRQRSAFKLDLAKQLGATHTILADKENTVERVMAITGGRGVDVAVDITPGSTAPVTDAIESVRMGGTIVLAGMKEDLATIDLNKIFGKDLTIHGAYSQGPDAYQQAIEHLSRNLQAASKLHTHEVPLRKVDYAMALLAGEVPGEEAISITLHPEW